MATVKIKGMSCQHCVGSVKKALESLPGISEVEVNLEKGEAYYQGDTPTEEVKKTISSIGFEVIAP